MMLLFIIFFSIHLKNAVYWKNVAKRKCKNLRKFYDADVALDTDWQRLGVQTKFEQILETTTFEDWDETLLNGLAKKSAPFIEKLALQQLQPIQNIKYVDDGAKSPVINVPILECHHGSLELLKWLNNLEELELCFGLNSCAENYSKRFFECSYDDILNLGNGLRELRNLKFFRIHFTPLDGRKMTIILKNLKSLAIKSIDFSFCQLDNTCCLSISDFLLQNSSVESIELQGNCIGPAGCQSLGYALKYYQGSIVYLGLSKNPILERGILAIGGGFLGTNQIRHLNLAACDLENKSGALRACQIIGCHLSLEQYNISNIQLDKYAAEKMFEGFQINTTLCKLDVRCCGLTFEHELDVNILIKRNLYYKEYPCLNRKHIYEKNMFEILNFLQNKR